MGKPESVTLAVAELFDQEVDFLQRLIRARSPNPYVPDMSSPDNPVEELVAAEVLQELQRLGFQAVLHGISPRRSNVLCTLPGGDVSGKTLILTTHMDTVAPSDGYIRDPWEAQIEDDRLFGLGAADAKAQIAIFVYAALALRRAGITLAGKVILAFVVDEESGACSPYETRYLLDQHLLPGDAVIVGEPGSDKIAIAHRGLYRFRLKIQGEATHVGLRAWEQGTRGHNAILDMARVALVLSTCSLPAAHSAAFPNRRSVLTFPTLISGGSGMNIVPDSCEAYGDVRLLPGITGNEIRRLIEEQLKELSIESYQLDDLVSIPAVETDRNSEIVRCLLNAAEAVTGAKPRVEGVGPACDGWMFITRGIPTVCGYGVECGGVHGADEWVDLDSLRTITEVYAQTIMHYLG